MPKLNMPPERLKALIAERESAKANKDAEFSALFSKARKAGVEAGMNCRPVPMVVGQAKALAGAGACEIDYSKPVFYVDDGACGFAWVNVRPGNSPFANWLKSKKLASPSYAGGVEVWVSDFGQSVDRKDACAHAMARVFQDAGIKAYAGSRLD